jgi:hypothetical protein
MFRNYLSAREALPYLVVVAACSVDSRMPTAGLSNEVDGVLVEEQPPSNEEVDQEVPSPNAAEPLGSAPEMPLNTAAPPELTRSNADAGSSPNPDAGVINVVEQEIVESFELTIGMNAFVYECRGGAAIGGSVGVGPVLRTIYARTNGNDCDWPSDLDIGIYAQFVGFLESEQRLAVGEFDLSDPTAVEHVRVSLYVNRLMEVPVGTTPTEPSSFVYQSFLQGPDLQFTQLPNLTGTVISRRDESVSLERYLVELTDVTLLADPNAQLAEFPASVTIHHATLLY